MKTKYDYALQIEKVMRFKNYALAELMIKTLSDKLSEPSLTFSDQCYFLGKIKDDLDYKRRELYDLQDLELPTDKNVLNELEGQIKVLEMRYDLIMRGDL